MNEKYRFLKSMDFCGTLDAKMKSTKAFVRKMTLGHEMRKITHFIRIRAQKWIWRPVESAWCLMDVTSNQEIG